MRKLIWLAAVLLGGVGLYNSQSHQQPAPVTTPASIYAAPEQTSATTVPHEAKPSDESDAQPELTQEPAGDEQEQSDDQQPSELSNDNHYTNSDGDSVHSPAYSNTIPAGATAQCSDGTYSFSQHRQGTCSHHGGVSERLH
jgi:hypothetical protein